MTDPYTEVGLEVDDPTGEVAWPLLIVEGKEKAGKTWAALQLTKSDRVGHCIVIQVGETRADEYRQVGRFKIARVQPTLQSIVAAIRAVMALPPLDGKPTVLIIDTGSGIWDLVKRHAEKLARSSKRAQQILRDDPEADIDIAMSTWNKAKDTYWWPWINQLRGWDGIAIITARADEVAKVQGGQPVAGQTEYRLELEKSTAFMATARVQVRGDRSPLLVWAASMHVDVPSKGIELPRDGALEHLVFDVLGAGGEFAEPLDADLRLDRNQAKQAALTYARQMPYDGDPKALAATAWDKVVPSGQTQFQREDMAVIRRSIEEIAGEAAEAAPVDNAGDNAGDNPGPDSANDQVSDPAPVDNPADNPADNAGDNAEADGHPVDELADLVKSVDAVMDKLPEPERVVLRTRLSEVGLDPTVIARPAVEWPEHALRIAAAFAEEPF